MEHGSLQIFVEPGESLLEAAGLVQTVQAQGRIVTAQGRSLMDNAAHAVRATVQKDIPALKKY